MPSVAMDADSARLIAEILRIADGSGEDTGVAFPLELELREAITRLQGVAEGAGWAAIPHALIGLSQSSKGFQGPPRRP